MQGIKRWLFITLLIIVIILSAGFSLWNTTPVPLSFGFYTFADRPLAVWVIVAFCLGGLCGLVLGAGLIRDVRLRYRIRKLEKELQRRPKFPPAEREL